MSPWNLSSFHERKRSGQIRICIGRTLCAFQRVVHTLREARKGMIRKMCGIKTQRLRAGRHAPRVTWLRASQVAEAFCWAPKLRWLDTQALLW